MADDSKPSKLSLPGKPASGERRTRAPLRGSSKPRPPAPGYDRFRDPNEAERSPQDRPARNADERPRGSFGERPPRPAGDRPQREGRSFERSADERRPWQGDRPRHDNARPQRSYRDEGGDRRFSPHDKPRTESEHGSRRPAFDDGREHQRRNFAGGGERPRDGNRPSWDNRPARPDNRGADERRPYSGEHPRRDERPARPAFNQSEERRPPREGRGFEERRPYQGERPRRDDSRPSWGERPARPEGRSFGDAARRPAFNQAEERRPYQGEHPRREDSAQRAFRSRDERPTQESAPRRDFQTERPAFRTDRRPQFDAPRSYGERPRRDVERDGPAPAPSFGDDMLPAAPRGNSFGRSRATPREETAQESSAALDKPRRPAPPERFANAPAAAPLDQAGAVRLSKLMSELGLCSRREADDYIERGWVKVDGEVVAELGSKVLPHQHIELNAVAEEMQLRRVTILINKPIGYVSGQAEDGYEPAAMLITPENHWTEDPTRRRFESRIIRKLAPAGRLDIDSTGLLVLTQDGRVAKQLIGEYSDVEKEYLVRVEGELSEEGMRLLHHGLELDGVELAPAKVSWQNEDQLRFVLKEGRKRQIRRMCELVGLKVVGLKRIRIGRIPLGKLPLGQWRYLSEFEAF